MSRLKERLAEKIESLPENIPFVESAATAPNAPKNAVLMFPDRATEVSIVPDFAITLNEARQRIKLLQDFVREMMVLGIDYGNIPGCDKPSLLKPGAEKLCDIFGFSKTVEILHRVEDWQNGFAHYEVKVTLTNKKSGVIEAEGLGSCNTKERKFAKQDPYTILNSILKMAKKRSLVDAVLSATRASGIFTQDTEDFSTENILIDKNRAAQDPHTLSAAEESVNVPQTNQQPRAPIEEPEIMATGQQHKYIQTLIDKANLRPEQVHTLIHRIIGVNSLRELSKRQASDFITFLKENI